jgi:hypothetical protein
MMPETVRRERKLGVATENTMKTTIRVASGPITGELTKVRRTLIRQLAAAVLMGCSTLL